jgi:hypothetical protein
MSRRFLTPLNVLHLAAAPSSPSLGDLYFNTTEGVLYTFDGTNWVAGAGTTGAQGLQGIQGFDGVQGTQGLQGSDGANGQSFNFKGEYDNSYAYYHVGDTVSYLGNMYVCYAGSGLQGIDPTNTDFWQLVAAQGTQGTAGYVGSDGAQGTQGVQGTAGSALIEIDGGSATSNYGGIMSIDAGTATG